MLVRFNNANFTSMNSVDKKHQVFVSSTFEDLISPRAKVMEAILRMYQIPIGMEMFSAGNDEQWTIISKTIQDSDYYLLIVGHRYGSMTEEGISYTEKEFDFAKSIGIPVFAFLRSDDVATLPRERDTIPEKQKMQNAFREKVSANAIVEFWREESDLVKNVTIALFKLMHQSPRPGWIRADKALSPEVGKELALLSKENRDLKNELEEYKLKEAARLPDFKLYANDNEILSIELKNIPARSLMGYIEPLLDDVIEATMIDLSGDNPKEIKQSSLSNVIKEYNTKIAENKDAVDIFNAAYERQRKIEEHAFEVSFNIENIGTKKAKELYVEITFPESILLFGELPEKKQIPRPKEIPPHPYSFNNQNLGVYNSIALRAMSTQFNFSKILPVASLINPPNFQINGQTLSIKIDTLLHTRQKCISDSIYLVPLVNGVFNAKVKYMCEEFEGPIETTFEIIVKNEK